MSELNNVIDHDDREDVGGIITSCNIVMSVSFDLKGIEIDKSVHDEFLMKLTLEIPSDALGGASHMVSRELGKSFRDFYTTFHGTIPKNSLKDIWVK